MKLFDPLYSRDSKGNIVSWEVNVTEHQDFSTISIHEGLLEGKKTLTTRNIRSGKNLSKMNETTKYEQACSEANSRWERKKKQGYKSMTDLGIHLLTDLDLTLPIDRTDANGNIKPMKAQKYFKDDGSVRIKFPCIGQPKLNGFRVVAELVSGIRKEANTLFETDCEGVVFRSKEGLEYNILEHIADKFPKNIWNLEVNNKKIKAVFDGEMYIEGEILSEISSAVRKRNPKTSKIKFYIFDLAIEGINQKTRIKLLNDIGFYLRKQGITDIVIVQSEDIRSNQQAQEYTDKWIKEGYEGGIFRDSDAHYQFGKRPQTMVKLKRSQDKEFIITDVVGGDNSPELGVFVCLAENGKTFKVTPEGTIELKKEYLTNKPKYIGKQLTVRFFERTIEDLPFHAVGTTIRDYE